MICSAGLDGQHFDLSTAPHYNHLRLYNHETVRYLTTPTHWGNFYNSKHLKGRASFPGGKSSVRDRD